MQRKLLSILSILVILTFLSSQVSSLECVQITENNDTAISDNDDGKEINLKRGDIVFRYIDPDLYPMFRWFMHPLIFTGAIHPGSSSGPEYEFVEAHGGKGVCYTYKSEYSIKRLGALYEYVYRVDSATEKQIDNAVAFAISQIGNPFMEIHKQRKIYDPTENNSWYCTEIIWAAYFNCDFHPDEGIYGFGVNIDPTPGHVYPSDIQDSPNTHEYSLFKELPEEKSKLEYNSNFINVLIDFFKNNNIFKNPFMIFK